MNTLDGVTVPAPPSNPPGLLSMLAHQGGWDEILMVVAPLAVIGGLLWLANRRVTAQLETELQDEAAGDERQATSGDDGQD